MTRHIFAVCSLVITTSLWGIDPSFEANIPVSSIKQGATLRIDLQSNLPITQGTITCGDDKFTVYANTFSKQKNDYISYIGISRYLDPSLYECDIMLVYPNGDRVSHEFQLTILEANFRKSNVTLSGDKKNLAENRDQLSKEGEIIGEKLKTITRKAHFDSPFIWPTEGSFTTPFGAYRTYNGVPSSRHSGTDIANIEGTPINAAHHGTIILSQKFESHGETILIDHGFGIVSIYNHLSKRDVIEGDWVNQGQKIGEMGNTGISSGPHLHWGMSVQNVRVNPPDWINQTSLFDGVTHE
jgi:murein DD-endopeptidase MepM/ murein hydrolase activator NlpD